VWIKVDPNGIQQQYKNEAFQRFLGDSATFGYQSTGAYILVAVGAFIMFVGFLGCCGAIRESQCMLAMVSVPILYILLLSEYCSNIYPKRLYPLESSQTLFIFAQSKRLSQRYVGSKINGVCR